MKRFIVGPRIRRPSLLVFAACALAAAVALPACESDDGPAGVGPRKPYGLLLSRSSCKMTAGGEAADALPNQDCVEWSYAGGTLDLTHVNAAFNCCPMSITADITITDDEITIVEHEARGQCDCTCRYDLAYRIVKLPEGIYTIRFIEPYLLGDPPLAVRVGLASNPSGAFCVERTHYPWPQP